MFVTNGVAPASATLVGVNAAKLPGARPLKSLVGANYQSDELPRVPVLAPLPDGSGVHAADLVSFMDDSGTQRAAIAVGDIAISGILDATADGRSSDMAVHPDAFVATGDATPSYLSFRGMGGRETSGLPIERNPIERTFRFLEGNAPLFHTGQARCQFVPTSLRVTPEGEAIVRLAQRHATLPIFGAELVVAVGDNRVLSTIAHTVDEVDVDMTPTYSAADAIQVADEALDIGTAADPNWQPMVDKSRAEPALTRLGVLPEWAQWNGAKQRLLAYEVRRGAFTFYVDAHDGKIRNASSGIDALTAVTDAHGASEFGILGYERESTDGVHLPGASFNTDTLPSRFGGPTASGLATVANVYRSLGWFGQNGRGSDFIANTNVDSVVVQCENSMFDSTFTQTAFFCLGFATTDIIGHEMTHGVIANSSGLVYQDESGAINEAFADLMGNLIFPDPAGTWLVGEGIISDPRVPPSRRLPVPLRNMASFAHVSSYRHRDSTCDVFPWSCDAGFVHTNSGIVNKAHQLLADGSPRDGTPHVDGIGRQKLLVIAFRTMTRLPSNARMNDLPLAERDVCEGLVAAGARDLTGTPFEARDCDRISWAFRSVGLDPRLVSAWSPPELGFAGSETFFESPLDVLEPGCTVANIEANLVQLSGAQTIDLDPATSIPSTVTWGGLSTLALRVPTGSPPFPIGTRLKRHTIEWAAIYGYRPSVYTKVIPGICGVALEQQPISASFDEDQLFGGDSSRRLGPAASPVSPECSLQSAELELLAADGHVLDTGISPSHTITHTFLFIPVHFTMRASVISPPAPYGASPGPHDLSGTFSYHYDLGRGFHVRWRYHFTAPDGVTCSP